MPLTKTRHPLTREDWIEAARKVLVVSGVDDVKVDRLAKKLKVTRGSFYWHFKDRKDLHDALLLGWVDQNRRELNGITERSGGGRPSAIEFVRVWLTEDPANPTFDMAIRFWARKSAKVAALVHKIDDEWIALIQSMLQDSSEDEFTALARARVMYFQQIGYYAVEIQEPLEARLRFAPHYHKVLVGSQGEQELADLIEELRERARSPARSRVSRKAVRT